jgi:predicted AlkP superfamily pyrophosphatase or phosphodiesterase
MKRITLWAAALSACFLAVACSPTPAETEAPVAVAEAQPVAAETPDPASLPRVLMIGLDGLQTDMVDKWNAPNLRALAARGVQAEAMVPVMPTKTFVNFYSLATGLYPEHHGMVDNAPYDRALDEQFQNDTGPQDARWWGGEPIWITAEKQGLNASIMFWLGSEVEIEGLRPSRWTPYEHEKPYQDRVDEVLSWFDGPADTMPRFAAVYFDRVDTAGHYFGPDSDKAKDAVLEVDGYVGQLIDGLKARGLLDNTTIIVVSDHGMVNIDEARSLDVGALLNLDQLVIPQFTGAWAGSGSPFLQIYGEGDALDAAYAALKDFNPHIHVWKRGEMPANYHFDHPTRGPDLFVLADPGWSLQAKDMGGWRPLVAATHGYDNLDPSMRATFIGAGPIFPEGEQAAPFENVNVYLMAACALGLIPAKTDGDPAVVERVTEGRCPANRTAP